MRKIWPTIVRDTGTIAGVFLLLPGLLWMAAGQFWFVDRGLINLDYLLLGALMMLRRSWLWPLLMAILIGLDIVFALAPAYHFSPGSVASSAAEVMRLAPLFALSKLALVLLVSGLGGWLLLRGSSGIVHRRLASLGCMALLVIGVSCDALLSGSTLRPGDATGTSFNLAFSGLNNARVAWATAGTSADSAVAPAPEYASRELHIDAQAGGVGERNVVLVVVESLGLFADPALQALQLAPLMELGNDSRFRVRSGSVAFSGSTVPGELRELCGIRLHSVHPDAASLPQTNCLPARMRLAGYESMAVHGYLGTVFSRDRWYPALGFNRIWFAQQLDQRATLARCGIAYNGWCDTDVWRALVRELSADSGRRRFVYWLTLSAHLPLPTLDHVSAKRLCTTPALAGDGNACALFTAHHELLSAIADDLRSDFGQHTRLLLVGDHAPPFLSQHSRALFDGARVPFVEVRPAARN